MLSIKKIRKLPDAPGVYFFTRGREILYIGKATSLRDRVRSYFPGAGIKTDRGGRIVRMLALATGIRYRRTDSVLEALLLGSKLIKQYQPKYNVKAKDDKSFWSVVITKEEWPRVLAVRGKNLNQGSTLKNSKGRTFLISAIFGPFPNSNELRAALKIIRKIFPFRDSCKLNSGRPCFNYQLGLCPGVCVATTSPSDYQQIIKQIKLLFLGRKKNLIRELVKLMRQAVRTGDFEQAALWRDKIFALRHLQDISLIKRESLSSENNDRVEAYDIAHLAGGAAVGAMVVAEGGELRPSAYRKFKVAHGADDLANLREVLERRLTHHDWPRPDLIVVDGGANQLNAAKNVLAGAKIVIPVISVAKDERHQPKDILGAGKLNLTPAGRRLILLLNHEAHRFALAFHRHRQRKII